MSSDTGHPPDCPIGIPPAEIDRLLRTPGSSRTARKTSSRLLRQQLLAMIGNFGSERYGYVVAVTLDSLVRYYEDPGMRAYYQAAGCTLMGSRFAAVLMFLLHGVRIPVITESDLIAHLLVATQPDERIVMIGVKEFDVRRMAAACYSRDIRVYTPPAGFAARSDWAHECLTFIEKCSPFRVCFLAVPAPSRQMIVDTLRLRGTVKGLVVSIGA
jgi:UDP-N-acetyl-D-mannosaminuronic acid transferase (WecB/TagA/CpsF family)